MNFFESAPARDDTEEPQTPEWLGPQENVLPVPFPLWLVLARTGDVMLVVHGGLAYPNGFGFTMTLRRRRAREGPGDDPIHLWHTVRGGEIPPEALRLGLQFGNGTKATVFDGHRWFSATERPEGPVLIQRGGNGSAHSWELGFWSWPLPPPGHVAFVCEWPSEGVVLTREGIDSELILQAAARTETLWPDDVSAPRSAGSGYLVTQSIRQASPPTEKPD